MRNVKKIFVIAAVAFSTTSCTQEQKAKEKNNEVQTSKESTMEKVDAKGNEYVVFLGTPNPNEQEALKTYFEKSGHCRKVRELNRYSNRM